MPSYLTLHIELDRADSPGLVRRVYDALAESGAPFRGVHAWGCDPDMPLEAIIAWNQARLDRGFQLGMRQHVSKDYRQVLLALPPFSQARVFLMLRGDGVGFHLIVPEAELDDAGTAALDRLARALWFTLRPRSIQSSGEYGAATSHRALLGGAPPDAQLFAILSEAYPAGPTGWRQEPVPGGRWVCRPSTPSP